MTLYKCLAVVFVVLGLLACSDKGNEEIVVLEESGPVPAIPLKSLYAKKLNCPTLPNPPQQYWEINPEFESFNFRACLNFEVGTNKLTQKSEEVWRDFRCRTGYAKEFYLLTVQHHLSHNNIIDSEIIFKEFSRFKQAYRRFSVFTEQKSGACDVVVDITPILHSRNLNEQWHICYPMAQTWNLECSEKYGCRCTTQTNSDESFNGISKNTID